MVRPFVAALSIHAAAASLSCLDNDGKAVDWWFMYKLPNGFKFAYSDENYKAKTKELELFTTTMDDTKSPVALTRTLQSLLGSEGEAANLTASKASFLMYNDQPDHHSPGADYGHTKGVFAPEAFYLLHSTPHFPSTSGSRDFYFPEKETKYGQTFLCVTLNSKADTDTIANHMLYTTPYVYFQNIPSSLTSKHPALGKVLNKEWNKDAGTTTGTVKVASNTFTFFGKNAAWNNDLYEFLVAPGIKSSLMVESWLRGSKEGNYCKPKYKYEVVDVESMNVTNTDGEQESWKETQDHAKWAIATDGSKVLCVGDINRMTTQRKRGGGAVCFSHPSLGNALKVSISSATSCGSAEVVV